MEAEESSKPAKPEEPKPKIGKQRFERYSGGPHGFGDPDDLWLREVEKTVVIPELVRKKAREVKCTELVKEYTDCMKAHQILVIKCRPQGHKLADCLHLWFHDEGLNEECKQEYLAERAEYRRTGIGRQRKKLMGQLREEVEKQRQEKERGSDSDSAPHGFLKNFFKRS